MGFLDKVKKAFASPKKEDAVYPNSDENIVDERMIDKPDLLEGIVDDANIPDEKIQSEDFKDYQLNDESIDNQATASGDIRNFKYLDDLIHSGLKDIVLDSDIILSDGEESEYGGGINLDIDDLSIDGNGHTISSQGKARIFSCTGKNIRISNVTLRDGIGSNGGAIFLGLKGVLTIADSKLLENTAYENGGAIYNYKGELTISSSILSLNTGTLGGAIYNEQGEFLPIGNSFHKDGAIVDYSKLAIFDSTLRENTAHVGGGAIFNWGGEVTVNDSSLSKNTAKEDNGVIYNIFGSFKISDCEISNNKSKGNLIQNMDHMEIANSIFKDNESDNILENLKDGFISILYGAFLDNIGGSVVFNDGKSCFIEKTHFKNNGSMTIANDALALKDSKTINIANNTDLTLTSPKIDDEGKTILNRGYLLINKGCDNLLAQIDGRGQIECEEDLILNEESFDFGYLDRIIHKNSTDLIVLEEDIALEKYERDYYEGGIELDMDDLVIDGNGHTIDGADKSRIFLVSGDNITLKNIIFKNGYSHKNYGNPFNNNGGAIKINHNIRVRLENCEFISNTSETHGGAINSNASELTISNCRFSHNSSIINGGAIHNNKGTLSVSNSTFLSNETLDRGGAIDNNGDKADLSDSTFSNNTGGKGGAVHNSKGKIYVSCSRFSQNMAKWVGGAIDNDEGLFVLNSSFLKNRANWSGGAINNYDRTYISDSTFADNSAKETGGAVHNTEEKIYLSNSTLSNNRAKHGGAISNNEGDVSLLDSTLSNNIAEKAGGAIWSNKYDLDIKDCVFEGNSPDDFSDSIK